MHISFSRRCTHANESRTAGLPGCYDTAAHRKQMEDADPAKPAGPPVAIQRNAPFHSRISQKVRERE